jgi:probable HAF family extracellular repeat protein
LPSQPAEPTARRLHFPFRGRPEEDTVWHAQLYSNGTLTDLGTLGGSNSWAYGIYGGIIVGDADTATGADHAFLYRNGKMTDLNSLINPNSGWTLQTTTAINGSGDIVGVMTNASGQTDGFLLDPVFGPKVASPEPRSLSLLFAGVIMTLSYTWLRRVRLRRVSITSRGGQRAV